MEKRCYQNFVGGQSLKNNTNETFDVVNPGTGEVNYSCEVADEAVLTTTIETAKKGFEAWSKLTTAERTRILNKVMTLLRERNDELAVVEVEDTGKPFQEAVSVDVPTGADAFEYFAGLAMSIEGTHQMLGEDFYYTKREPLGVCLGIGAWNYPLQIACWKAAPALAAGNSMIFKPSEETPLGALKLAEIFIEAGAPEGVFNVVFGDGRVGEWLSRHPDIAKVSFTGEVTTGKLVMKNGADTLKRLTMELGGKSPLIIFDDANLDNAVSAAMLGNFYTQGEICTNCTRVYVHESCYDAFLKKLLTRIDSNIVQGNPALPDTNVGALISKNHLDKVLGYIESAKKEGATLLCGGHTVSPENAPNGYYVAPTVFTDCKDDMTHVKEEIFGPVMSVFKFSDESEVIRRANDTTFGLAAGVFTQDIQRGHRVSHQLQAGICWINSYGLSPVEMPVGGYKHSGIGKENGLVTLQSYTQSKSIYVGMTELESPY